MSDMPTALETFNAVLAETRAASAFVAQNIRAMLKPLLPGNLSQNVTLGQFLRIDGWLRTLSKCDSPGDFQAVISATRAILEATIDVVLITSSPADAQRLLDWEESAKLKHAILVVEYYTRQKVAIPSEQQYLVDFATNERVRIEALRRSNGWADGKHRDRWTSNNLGIDAREADHRKPTMHLERFYETRFRELCWSTHGSGLAGARNIPPDLFPGLSAIALHDCVELAQLSIVPVLTHFGIAISVAEQAEQDFLLAATVARSAVLDARRVDLGL